MVEVTDDADADADLLLDENILFRWFLLFGVV